MTDKPLKNQRWEKFCQNIMKGMNQTEAYIKAGYSKNWADGHSARLAVNGSIVQRLNTLRKQAHKDYEISRNKILKLLDNMLDSDVITVTETELKELPKSIRLCVKEIDYKKKDGKVVSAKLKLYNKQKAMDIVNRMQGYYEPEKLEVRTFEHHKTQKDKYTDGD